MNPLSQPEKPESGSAKKVARVALLLAGGFALFAWLGTVGLGRKSLHSVWPVHSHYLEPVLAALMMWIYVGIALIAIVVWLLTPEGERNDK